MKPKYKAYTVLRTFRKWPERCLLYNLVCCSIQTPGSPTPSESPGPDSAVTTPTEQAAASPEEAFAQAAALSNEQENVPKELESQSNDIHEDDPSIHVDANNKEMKTVLEKASSTEVISALNLDSRLKSGSVVSLGSTRSGSYGSVASGISNGILENSAGSFTSVASSFSQHQPYGSHHGLVRYRSASGRPLSDIVSIL